MKNEKRNSNEMNENKKKKNVNYLLLSFSARSTFFSIFRYDALVMHRTRRKRKREKNAQKMKNFEIFIEFGHSSSVDVFFFLFLSFGSNGRRLLCFCCDDDESHTQVSRLYARVHSCGTIVPMWFSLHTKYGAM